MKRVAGLVTMPDATSRGIDGAPGANLAIFLVHLVRIRGLVAHQEVILGSHNVVLHPGFTHGFDKFM